MTRRTLFLSIFLLAGILSAQQIVKTLWQETATIANGASLSAAVDLKGRTLVGIVMPATWTTANITFQVSLDGTTYNDLYNLLGDELNATAAASRFIALTQFEFLPVRYVKVRSGTSALAVNQGGARTIILATRDVDGK